MAGHEVQNFRNENVSVLRSGCFGVSDCSKTSPGIRVTTIRVRNSSSGHYIPPSPRYLDGKSISTPGTPRAERVPLDYAERTPTPIKQQEIAQQISDVGGQGDSKLAHITAPQGTLPPWSDSEGSQMNRKNANSTMPTVPHSSKKWSSMQRRVSRHRELIQTTRIRVMKQRTRCLQQSQHVQDLQVKFIHLMNTTMKDGNFSQVHMPLNDLHRECQEAMAELIQDGDETRALEDHLSYLEYRLGKMEDQLYADAENALESTEGSDDSPDSVAEVSNQGDPSENLPPLLQEYYSRIGDVKILQDRLDEFESELRRELEARDTLRGEGRTVLPPDEEFFANHKQEQAQMQEELSQAQADVLLLRERCLHNGLTLDDFEDADSIPDIQTETIIASHQPYLHPTPESPIINPRSSRGLAPENSLITTFFNTRERVTNWITTGLDILSPRWTGPDRDVEENDPDSIWTKLELNPSPHLTSPQGNYFDRRDSMSVPPENYQLPLRTQLRRFHSETSLPRLILDASKNKPGSRSLSFV